MESQTAKWQHSCAIIFHAKLNFHICMWLWEKEEAVELHGLRILEFIELLWGAFYDLFYFSSFIGLHLSWFWNSDWDEFWFYYFAFLWYGRSRLRRTVDLRAFSIKGINVLRSRQVFSKSGQRREIISIL